MDPTPAKTNFSQLWWAESCRGHLIAPGTFNTDKLSTLCWQKSLHPSLFSTHSLQLLGGKVCLLLLQYPFTQSHFHLHETCRSCCLYLMTSCVQGNAPSGFGEVDMRLRKRKIREFLISLQATSVKSILSLLTLLKFTAAVKPCKSFTLITPVQFLRPVTSSQFLHSKFRAPVWENLQ